MANVYVDDDRLPPFGQTGRPPLPPVGQGGSHMVGGALPPVQQAGQAQGGIAQPDDWLQQAAQIYEQAHGYYPQQDYPLQNPAQELMPNEQYNPVQPQGVMYNEPHGMQLDDFPYHAETVPVHPQGLWDILRELGRMFFNGELARNAANLLSPPNEDYGTAGKRPLGRNIWGGVGHVDTHFPHTRPTTIDPYDAWVDRDGDSDFYINVGNDSFIPSFNQWEMMRRQADRGDFRHLGINSAEDLARALRSQGVFHVNELPREMQPARG